MGSGEGFTVWNFIVCTLTLNSKGYKSGRFRWSGHVFRMEENKKEVLSKF